LLKSLQLYSLHIYAQKWAWSGDIEKEFITPVDKTEGYSARIHGLTLDFPDRNILREREKMMIHIHECRTHSIFSRCPEYSGVNFVLYLSSSFTRQMNRPARIGDRSGVLTCYELQLKRSGSLHNVIKSRWSSLAAFFSLFVYTYILCVNLLHLSATHKRKMTKLSHNGRIETKRMAVFML
jgi:hypothetical protein